MKERDDSSSNAEYSIENLKILNNDIVPFRKILGSREFITIHINSLNPKYIDINMLSFLKINQLVQLSPEENIAFLYNKIILYTASNSLIQSRNSLIQSRNSINFNRSQNSSLQNSFKNENMKNIREETINTDIIKPKVDNNININKNINNSINIQNSIEKETNLNNNINNTHSIIINNKENILKNNKITENNKNFLLFKWIYHFYLIIGFIILLHYILFVFSKYDNSTFYKYICILLIFSLLYIGYSGIKNKNSNFKYYIFSGNNEFWINFLVFILTIISLIGLVLSRRNLELRKSHGIIDYLIYFVYIITLIVESIYLIYFDVIIKEITLEKNIINGNTLSNLNIELVDAN